MPFLRSDRRVSTLVACALGAALLGASSALVGVCGPFIDVTDAQFCPFVLEIFTLGITTGTSPTTYDPAANVSRLQMAAFLSRTVDGVLNRGSRRAALDQFSTPQNATVLGITTVGDSPNLVRSDGADLWVARSSGAVVRVRGSDGKLLDFWTGADGAFGVVVATGRILVTGFTDPGRLYRIDPSQPGGAATTVASNLGSFPEGISFDGSRVWTSNVFSGSVSIVTPGPSLPWTVTTITAGFSAPIGNLEDGANVWVTDSTPGTLLKLDGAGMVLQTVTVGSLPQHPIFDGSSIWVPNFNSNSVSVVRASSGAVLQTLTGNGLDGPVSAAFDGQRILVTSFNADGVSLWKAADLTPLGFFGIGAGTHPNGACSDGVNFWITLLSTGHLARF